jgi:hypothetical protein
LRQEKGILGLGDGRGEKAKCVWVGSTAVLAHFLAGGNRVRNQLCVQILVHRYFGALGFLPEVTYYVGDYAYKFIYFHEKVTHDSS